MVRKPSSRSSCASVGKVTAHLLLSFFALAPIQTSFAASSTNLDFQHPQQLPFLDPASPGTSLDSPKNTINNEYLEFELRHIFHHGTYLYPNLHRRLDIHPDNEVWLEDEEGYKVRLLNRLRAKSDPISIQRLAVRDPVRINSLLDAARSKGSSVDLEASDWVTDIIPGPRVTDKETLLSLAKMAANAYSETENDGDWLDVGSGFNRSKDFGWRGDGLRGHVFADKKNSTIIIGLKGTSVAIFDGHGTTTNDKINDNLLFSCCCGQGSHWNTLAVCDCKNSVESYSCNSTCVVEALKSKNRYYYASQELYRNVTALYPKSDIWLVGHSLGGSVSSLLGQTFGQPVVTFEAVPEAMAAKRLGIPTPPEYRIGQNKERPGKGVFHFGNTADSVFMGTCKGIGSVCTYGGFAMESLCHTGMRCVYDTVKDLGVGQGITYHRILTVISQVLEKYEQPALCEPVTDCTDCGDWKFFESHRSNDSTTTQTTTTSSYHRTRTATCKTPGWWGCLDETTTITTTKSTTTTSSSTSTCKTPGWFGCLDETTTTTSTATSSISPPTTSTLTASSTCLSPGWFGRCHDKATSTSGVNRTSIKAPPPTSPPPMPTKPPKTPAVTQSSTTCTSKAWFGLICVDPSPTFTHKSRTKI